MHPHSLRPARDERGSALIVVLLITALLTAVSLTVAVISTNNLSSSRAAQQAGAAVNAADAGVAQGVTYLRTVGVAQLNACSPTCPSNSWGNKDNPTVVTIPGKGGQKWEAWIEPIAPYPANKPGLYRVHSTGFAGGPAARSVTADVTLDNYKIPFGISAKSINGGGNAGVHRQSIFTTGCVYMRSKIEFEGMDLVYGQPAAVHSSQIITDSQGSGQYCPDTKKPIHDPSASGGARYCNTAYPYDQDKYGGPLTGTSCRGSAGAYPQTSLIESDEDLFKKYKFTSPALTKAQQDALKTLAISQGNYYTTATGWTSPTQSNAVMYFDLTRGTPGGLVDLNDLTGFSRPVNLSSTNSQCLPKSLVIVIDGGNARINSNTNLYASVFLTSGDPYGQIRKANGNSAFIGTLYANSIDLTGTTDIYMDECFLNNVSPALFSAEVSDYRELDR